MLQQTELRIQLRFLRRRWYVVSVPVKVARVVVDTIPILENAIGIELDSEADYFQASPRHFRRSGCRTIGTLSETWIPSNTFGRHIQGWQVQDYAEIRLGRLRNCLACKRLHVSIY